MVYSIDLDTLDVELTTIGSTTLVLTLLSVPSDVNLTGVEVVYRTRGLGAWTKVSFSSLVVGTTLTITGLTASTSYEVFARCLSATDESDPDGIVLFNTISSGVPVAQPIENLILDDIVSTLAAIVQGPEYYGQFVEVTKRRTNGFQQVNKPCAIVYSEETEEDVITQNQSQRVVLKIVIEIHFIDSEDIDNAARKWSCDVKKALAVDDSRGGYAVNSTVVGTVPVHSEELPDHGALVVFMEVVYRHLRTDPTTVRC